LISKASYTYSADSPNTTLWALFLLILVNNLTT